eukprot:scaffold8603_cov109-Isochrysis_galbana.AAC.7
MWQGGIGTSAGAKAGQAAGRHGPFSRQAVNRYRGGKGCHSNWYCTKSSSLPPTAHPCYTQRTTNQWRYSTAAPPPHNWRNYFLATTANALLAPACKHSGSGRTHQGSMVSSGRRGHQLERASSPTLGGDGRSRGAICAGGSGTGVPGGEPSLRRAMGDPTAAGPVPLHAP